MSATITQQSQTDTSRSVPASSQQSFASQGRTLAATSSTVPSAPPSEVHCTACPAPGRPNTEIQSVPIEESEAFPVPQNDQQPADWNQSLHGNPVYRPINRHVDFSIRPLGQNNVERTFLVFMLSGVMIQNWANVAWRSTIGRFTDRAFLFKLGGTW